MPRLRPGDPVRNHPLFPMMDYISKNVYRQEQLLHKVDKDVTTIKKVQEELKLLMNDNIKKSFTLKDKGYEVRPINNLTINIYMYAGSLVMPDV